MSCSYVPRAPPCQCTGWSHVSWCIVYPIARQRTPWITSVGRAWPAVPRPVTSGVQPQTPRVPPPDDMHAGRSQTSGRVMHGWVRCRTPPVSPDHASDAAGWHTAALPPPHQRALPPPPARSRPSLTLARTCVAGSSVAVTAPAWVRIHAASPYPDAQRFARKYLRWPGGKSSSTPKTVYPCRS